jgi:hypothetical protein
MRTADNLTTFMCRLSRNSGASTSRNPKGLCRPVVGKLNLFLTALLKTGLKRRVASNGLANISYDNCNISRLNNKNETQKLRAWWRLLIGRALLVRPNKCLTAKDEYLVHLTLLTNDKKYSKRHIAYKLTILQHYKIFSKGSFPLNSLTAFCDKKG